jgi:hypothetical protein
MKLQHKLLMEVLLVKRVKFVNTERLFYIVFSLQPLPEHCKIHNVCRVLKFLAKAVAFL